MDAHVGDQFVIKSRTTGKPNRTGEIIECLDQGGLTPHFRVRWSDGHESIVYPGPDATVQPADAPPGRQQRMVSIDLRIEEDSDQCEAIATMRTTVGELRATGQARRNPTDPEIPMIGEELAIARALEQLAAMLEAQAREAIDVRKGDPASHLVP